MKDLMQRMISFLTFDFPERINFVSLEFETLHSKLRAKIPQWSSNATSKKLIAHYWFSYVIAHFTLIMALGSLFVLAVNGWSWQFIIVLALVSTVTFPVFLFFNYGPNFYSHFIPMVETVKERYQQKEREDIEKCRQMQLSNLPLTLIYYVFDKTGDMKSLQATESFSMTLTQLFGVDNGSLQKNTRLILGAPGTVRKLSPRRKTEIRTDFSEAYEFLESVGFKKGVVVLKELESKFFM